MNIFKNELSTCWRNGGFTVQETELTLLLHKIVLYCNKADGLLPKYYWTNSFMKREFI
jgi:hypothetical protein